jgi:uncharacterized membrane protein YbjE (DUF340 family)
MVKTPTMTQEEREHLKIQLVKYIKSVMGIILVSTTNISYNEIENWDDELYTGSTNTKLFDFIILMSSVDTAIETVSENLIAKNDYKLEKMIIKIKKCQGDKYNLEVKLRNYIIGCLRLKSFNQLDEEAMDEITDMLDSENDDCGIY